MSTLIAFDRKFPFPLLGIDEVAIGCVAGPACAVGVVLPEDPQIIKALLEAGAYDSKSVSRMVRNRVMSCVEDLGVQYYFASMDAEILDRHGMGVSVNMMFTDIITRARKKEIPRTVLIDGKPRRGISFKHVGVIRGDTKSLAIAVASIIAKYKQVQIMEALAQLHPGYGWERNHGYLGRAGSQHRIGLREHGVTRFHRKSYKPIKKILRGLG